MGQHSSSDLHEVRLTNWSCWEPFGGFVDSEVASCLELKLFFLETYCGTKRERGGEQEGRKEVWTTKSSSNPLKQKQFDLYFLMEVNK